MLISYLQTTRRILKDANFAKYLDGDLIDWINIGRGQLAGESECVRVYATLTLEAEREQYPFSLIAFPSGTLGVASVLNVRMMTYQVPGTGPGGETGNVLLTPREWEFFNTFVLAQPIPVAGPPDTWTQFGQGVNGTIILNLPDGPYVLNVDTVCLPSALASDADVEAIPALWTDAVPYYAAYLAMLTAHEEGADNMLKLYELFTARARQFANPSVLPTIYAQAPDPVMSARLGVTR